MIRIYLLALVVLTTSFSLAQPPKKTKLVVGVVVDQMRYEYLHRFANHYGNDGFKRLMNDGFQFKNAHFNYIPTYTGPGHASVYTGTTPRVHGIIGNDWYDKYEKKNMYCVEDQEVNGVGGSGKVGQRSPKNLRASTVTDELQLFYQNRSKVISVSIKDRGAILPAGHQPTGAYWYDGKSGNFITSTFYQKVLPDWVIKFNVRKLPKSYMKKEWDTYKPIVDYVESARDDRPYEFASDFKNLPNVFPYDFKEIGRTADLNEVIKVTPYGNSLVAEMALAAIDGEGLGQDSITDFLAVSFSSTDYIGHAFGPYSKEIQDTYVRLDLELARLMKSLDEKVGKGNWTLFLTADHAVADIPAYLKEQGHSVDYVTTPGSNEDLMKALEERFGTAGLVENVSNHQIFLNKELISEKQLNIMEIKNFLVMQLHARPGVGLALDAQLAGSYGGNNLDTRLLAAGINSRMSGDVVYTHRVGWLGKWNKANGGTTHGTGYAYDTHVPMIFYGWGIKKGSTVNYHPITDIAPTISSLLNIKFPSGCTGQPATELLD